jgi:hypothetical protein
MLTKKNVYRTFAKELHPDKNQDDPDASRKGIRVNVMNPVDGNCNICRNVGQYSIFDVAHTRKLKLYINVPLLRAQNTNITLSSAKCWARHQMIIFIHTYIAFHRKRKVTDCETRQHLY